MKKNADTSHYPASITKVMTALLALENCDLDEIVTFSEEAVYGNEGDTSHIAREVGEEMTLENCLYGMMLESANECAWAIGEHVGGGSMDKFVEMMNAKAKELGCTGTHFANPNGLPNPDHYVTARDMALIARAAYQYPEFRKDQFYQGIHRSRQTTEKRHIIVTIPMVRSVITGEAVTCMNMR